MVKRVRAFLAVWKRRRWRLALLAAVLSDAFSFGLEFVSLGLAEPLQIAVDLFTASVLMALLGFRWPMAVPLFLEAIPGVSAFPSWALAIAALAAIEPEEVPPLSPP